MRLNRPIFLPKSTHFSLYPLLAQSTNIALESIENIKTIKSFSVEDKQERLYAKQIAKTYDYAVDIAFSKAMFEGIITVLTFMSIACVIWYGSSLYLEGNITSGDMVSFLIIRYTFAVVFDQ